jgi:predicted metal-dependent hydrolase
MTLRQPAKRPGRRLRAEPIDRLACARLAVALFNAERFWDAHEALERIWRAVPDEEEAKVVQGLIQAAAALLHRQRGNQHGVRVVGEAALEKLAGPQRAAVEFDVELLREELARALHEGGPAPRLRLRDVQ